MPVNTLFDHVGTFTNAGVITMQNDVVGDRMVVTGQFIGEGGALRLDTVLGTDGSASDQLVLDGGAATGNTQLFIHNVNGAGALTKADGIQVVDTIHGAITDAGAFTLGSRVAVGAYEYLLFKGGVASTGGDPTSQDWYLRNTLASQLPNYRVEVPLDMALPMLAQQFGLAMLDTLDDRVGSKVPDPLGKNTFGAWLRLLGQTGERHNGHTFADFSKQGPSYNWGMEGLQMGVDVYRKTYDNGSSDVVGADLGVGRITSDVNQVYSTAKAGNISMDGYAVGAYWTHYGATGWYTDAVLQGSVYDRMIAHSVLGQVLTTAGQGYVASLESGWKVDYARDVSVTPEAQLVFQNAHINHSADAFGNISYSSPNALYGRVGGRVAKNWRLGENASNWPVTTWGRINAWHSFSAHTDTTFSSLSGENPVTLMGNIGYSWAQFSLGALSQLNKGTALFASGDLSVPFAGGQGRVWAGRLGVKYVS